MVPLGFMGAVVYRCGEKSLHDGLGSHFQYMAQKTIEAVDISVYQLSQQIRLWSRLDLMGDVLTGDVDGNIVSFLKGLSQEHSALVGAEVFNGSGEVIASTSQEMFGQKFPREEFFRKAIEGSSYISDVEFDSGSQNWIMQFAFPVWVRYDGHGGIAGVLRVKWNARDLSPMLRAPLEKKGYPLRAVFLTRKDGLVIAASGSAQPAVFSANLIEQKFASARLLQNREESFLIEDEVVDKQKYLAGFSHSKGYQDFQGLGWGVVVLENVREVFAPVRRLRLIMGGMGLLVMIGVVFVSLRLSKSIAAPVLNIAQAAQQVAGGNLDARVRYTSADEVGSLAENFNRMTTDIREQRTQLLREKSYIHSIITNMADALFVVDEKGTIKTVNQPAVDLLGGTQQEMIGKPIGGYIGGKMEFTDWVSRHLTSHSVVRDDGNFLLAKDGREIPVLFSTSAIFNGQGGIDGIICLAQDITERRQAQQELQHLHEQLGLEKRKLEQLLAIDHTLRSILDLNHLVDAIVENTTKILEADKCSVMLMDPDSRQLHIRGAQGLDEELVKATRIPWGAPIAGLVAKTGEPLLVADIEENSVLARENRPSYKSRSFMSVPIKVHNRVAGVINVADKISEGDHRFSQIDLKILSTIVRQASVALENADYYRKLEHLSVTDSLTGIHNHRHFLMALDQEIERVKRYPNPLCLLMLDIDDFKSYNDHFGHLGGDRLLKGIGRILKENLRTVDIVCRYAGDEFVVILPETDIPEAQIIAEKLRKAVKERAFEQEVTVSIGIAKFSATIDRRDLVMKADQALYQSKRGGKNKISCFY